MNKICYLQSLADPNLKIKLPDGVDMNIGRNKLTYIKDRTVSRRHLVCRADYSQNHVTVKTLGSNFSGCNGYSLVKGKEYTFKDGDRIEVIQGYHLFDIVFEENSSNEELGLKPNKIIKLNNTEPISSLTGWEHIDNGDLLIYTVGGCVPRAAIASFDIDGTIIKTKSGARFPKDFNDWMFNFPNVPEKLKDLYTNNHKIVFFTNQASLSRDASKIKEFKKKVEHIVSKLAVAVQVFVATGKSTYRKPMTGMWNVLSTMKNENIAVDLNKSFYVGDAAGREKNWAPKRNKDHSICDRLFALNIGIKFCTPEEYFLKASSVKYIMPEFDPRKTISASYPAFERKGQEQEVVIMVGVQGSGKSYFCKKNLVPKGYVYINRDSLGSWQKCVKKLEECLQERKSAVVDNTNPDRDSRAKYIEVAKRYKVKCRCFLMLTSHNQAKHNNKFREFTDKSHLVVSDIILNSYRKHFQAPDSSEGFDEIVEIPCIPEFDDPEKERLYKLFLLES